MNTRLQLIPELRGLRCLDLDLGTSPADPTNCALYIEGEIGAKGQQGADIFGCTAITPKAIAAGQDTRWGRALAERERWGVEAMKRAAKMSIAAALAIAIAACSPALPVPFDTTAWRNAENSASSSEAPRLRMADQLVNSQTLMGRPRSEIEAMLGPPSDTGKFQDYDLVYWLGPERGFMSIDSEWLIVRFNKSGMASDVQIVRD